MISFSDTPGHQLIVKTPGEYSMETAVALLHWLARRERCVIAGEGWKTAGYGDLVESGVQVQLDTIVFRVMSSYDVVFVERVAGSKDRFIALCKEIQGLEFEAT